MYDLKTCVSILVIYFEFEVPCNMKYISNKYFSKKLEEIMTNEKNENVQSLSTL